MRRNGNGNSKPLPQRRSRRMRMLVRIAVQGIGPNGEKFAEQTETVAVSAHGALILLGAAVTEGAPLTLRHRTTLEEVIAQVAHLGPRRSGKIEVGVQFSEPSPRFWRVTFPPDDWSPHLAPRKAESGETVTPGRG